jgi:radical SAM protein with 4Fe4S-binding SPASM domain
MPDTATYQPRRAVFEATLACNLHCRHCGSRAGRARPGELTVEECAGVFRDLKALGNRWLTIAGGEPTTRPDWLGICAAAADAGLRAGMLTNAVALRRDDIARAREAGLVSLGFSVDGIGAVHDRLRGKEGHFRRLCQAMDDCAAVGMPFAVVTCLTRLNLPLLGEIHDFVTDRGVYAWQVQFGTDMGNLSDHPDLLPSAREMARAERVLAALIRRSPLRIHVSDSIGYYGPGERLLRRASGGGCFGGCPAGTKVVGIESNGNIKGCLSILAGYNERAVEYVEGNVRETSLVEIWNRPGAFAYNRAFDLDELTGTCRECLHAARCRGGCMAKKVASGGGNWNPLCLQNAPAEERRRVWPEVAAAAALAASLGLCAASCDNVDEPRPDGGGDADSDGDADADGDGDTDVDYGIPEYGVPDTDTTTNGDDYGMPDTETSVDAYGIPDNG